VKSVGMIDNISAFIDSEADGCVIRGWFGDRAWIDYRPDEPNWIQMKFGTCKAHIKSLNYLHSISAWYGVLREKDVQDSKNLYKE
jgi:hypothetical protein